MVEITVTVLQIEITTIEIDSTILVIMVGDIIVQMVSPRIGAIVRIVTQINIKTDNFKAVTRVTIKATTQITLTIRVMVVTRGLSMVEKISIEINSKIIKTTNLNRIIDHNTGHSNYNSTSSFSDVSSFVTRDSVTFDARRNQGFPNACTVK